MLDLDSSKKLLLEFSKHLEDSEFLEYLEKNEFVHIVDDFYDNISIILIEFKERKINGRDHNND